MRGSISVARTTGEPLTILVTVLTRDVVFNSAVRMLREKVSAITQCGLIERVSCLSYMVSCLLSVSKFV